MKVVSKAIFNIPSLTHKHSSVCSVCHVPIPNSNSKGASKQGEWVLFGVGTTLLLLYPVVGLFYN